MQKKSGKEVKPVGPAQPKKPEEADEADPGKVEKVKAEQAKLKKGKYGKVEVKPFKPKEQSDEEEETSWIELQMVDEADEPVAGIEYEVTLPDGSVATGTLDSNGFARIEGCEPGQCEITFPGLDKDAWESA